jgi:hypothetical protein
LVGVAGQNIVCPGLEVERYVNSGRKLQQHVEMFGLAIASDLQLPADLFTRASMDEEGSKL